MLHPQPSPPPSFLEFFIERERQREYTAPPTLVYICREGVNKYSRQAMMAQSRGALIRLANGLGEKGQQPQNELNIY